MSRRIEPDPTFVLWIAFLGAFWLGTWLVAGAPGDDAPRAGKPEVSAVTGLAMRPIVLPHATMPPPMPRCECLSLQGRRVVAADHGSPPRAEVQRPTTRGPPPAFL
jgi:hypothetical protein